MCGLFQQATHHIWQSPDSGGEASYSWWDTRPSWVFPADGGVDFGRDGSARNVGAFPESALCAEDGYSLDEH